MINGAIIWGERVLTNFLKTLDMFQKLWYNRNK